MKRTVIAAAAAFAAGVAVTAALDHPVFAQSALAYLQELGPSDAVPVIPGGTGQGKHITLGQIRDFIFGSAGGVSCPQFGVGLPTIVVRNGLVVHC